MTPHQATCVAIGERALLIEGPSGCGKSTLALALIDRGAVLVGDDAVVLEAAEGQVVARPHPKTRGLIEVRNLGLVPMPVRAAVPVALALTLDPAAPRFVEAADHRELVGIVLPRLLLTPHDPLLAMKAELALIRYGLATRPLPFTSD
jgi:serine kinase of HPr protein (carbohydrate metabolism regulator)